MAAEKTAHSRNIGQKVQQTIAAPDADVPFILTVGGCEVLIFHNTLGSAARAIPQAETKDLQWHSVMSMNFPMSCSGTPSQTRLFGISLLSQHR